MSVLVGLSLTNHCLDHSEIFLKSVFTMLHKLFISYDFFPMDVSSANNLHKPIVSSAMSLINTKKRRVQGWTPALRLPFPEIAFFIITCCSLAEI